MMSAMHVYASDECCSGCRQPLTGSSITHSHFIGSPHRAAPLVNIGPDGVVHLHAVTVLPLGEERLRPTLRRAAVAARSEAVRRLRRHRRPLAALSALGLGVAVLAAARRT